MLALFVVLTVAAVVALAFAFAVGAGVALAAGAAVAGFLGMGAAKIGKRLSGGRKPELGASDSRDA